MGGVLCTGNLVLDILVRPVDQFPWGASLAVESIQQDLGGNGASTCFTLARLGISVRLAGMAGEDAFGDFVLRKLAAVGVDAGGVRRCAHPTATTVALVNSGGGRLFLHRFGSSGEIRLEPEEFEREIGPGVSHYHLASIFALPRMRPVSPELLRRARARGLRTSLDTNWDSSGRWLQDLAPCLPYTDLLFVNEDEARMLTGSTVPREAARSLRGMGAGTVVMKLGERGCAVFTPDGEIHSPGFAVPVVDTTGAGDCFVGGYLAALQRGAPHQQAARFANAVGALSVQELGAVDGVRSWEETEEWIGTAVSFP